MKLQPFLQVFCLVNSYVNHFIGRIGMNPGETNKQQAIAEYFRVAKIVEFLLHCVDLRSYVATSNPITVRWIPRC